MDDESLRDLLQGDVPDLRSRNRGRVLLVGVAVAVATLGLAFIFLRADRENQADVSALGAATTADTTTTTSTIPPLVAFEPDPPIVYYPRVLPEGMEVCSAQLGLPVTGDEMCDPDDEFRWVKIAVSSTGPPGGVVVEGLDGITVLRESPPEVGVTIGGAGYRLWAEGVPLDQLIEIAASLPIAADETFIPVPESRIDNLDEAALAELLGQQVSQIGFRGSAVGDWEVYAPGLTLYTAPMVEGMGNDIQEIAVGLAKTQLVSPRHSLIVGREENGQGAVAFWLQRDRFWRLDSERTLEQLIDLVESMEQGIEQLP